MHTLTSAWRLALVAAFALLLGPWASAQDRVGSRADRAESSASILSLPTTLEAATPVSASFMADVLNETFTSTFTGGPPAAPPGWIQLRAGTGTGATVTNPDWVRYTSSPCTAANPCARSNFYTGPASRRYLVSPQVTPSAAAGNTLSFRAGESFTTVYNSVLRIAVTTGAPTVANFDAPGATLRSLDENELPFGLNSYTVDLSAYNGQAIYIAFIHEQTDADAILLDDVRIAEPSPAVFTSSAATFQGNATNPGGIAAGEERWVFGGNVVIGGTVGSLPATSLTFSTTGTTDVADLASARLLYLGSSTTFDYATTPQFGSPVANPNGTMTFTGSQALLPGNNYFLLVYTASSSASVGNVMDATFESVTVDGVARTPSPTTLTGSLPIITRAANDNLARATVIWSGSFTGTGTNVNGSAESGETLPTCGNGSTASAASSWWSYTPETSGTVTISTAGSNFDTVLSLWTGTGFPLMQVTNGCNDDNPAGGAQSILSNLPVTGGTTYYIRVAGYNNATGSISLALTGPAPTPPFSFVRPTAGQTFKIGNQFKPIWDSDPAFASSNVEASLCLDGTCTAFYTGPNLAQPDFGDARFTIAAGTTPSTEYTVRLCVEGSSICAVSDEFTIYDRNDVFVVTSPAEAASGLSTTVEWTSPVTSPPGDVTVSITSRDGSTTFQSVTSSNDGTETFTLDPSVVAGKYTLSVCPVAGPAAMCGKLTLSVRDVLVTSPTASSVWTPGSTQSVSWSSAACSSGSSTVDIFLRSSSGGKVRLGDDEDCDGTADVTVPAGTADGADYFVHVQVWDGGTRVATGNSARFAVGTPIRMAGTAGFAAPLVSGAADAFVRVATPDLADGTEVAVSAGTLVLGTGVVRGGSADIALFGAVADPMLIASGLTEEEAVEYVAVGTELTISTWSAGAAVPFEIGRVTDAAGQTADALTFAYGAEYDVAAKGATASTAASAFSLDRVSPNPTSGTATVRFSLGEAQAARVTVYDVLGREVVTLFDGTASAGATEVRVPALTAGVYVVRVSTADASATSRFTVVR